MLFDICVYVASVLVLCFPDGSWTLPTEGGWGKHHHGAHEGNEHGAVACDSEKCSEIGTAQLLKGGNAVDAVRSTP